MEISNEVLDNLLKDCQSPEELFGQQGLLQQLSKRLIERALEAELTHHLGYSQYSRNGRGSGNSRNGKTRKKITTAESQLDITVPRDRNGEFEPQIVKKWQRRLAGFDEKVIALYAEGLSTRQIQNHLEDIYGMDVSADLISTVTDSVQEDVRQWRQRPLEALYPIVFLDALVVKVREEGKVKNKSVYVALGISTVGLKEVLGLWMAESESASFWMQVLSELRNRGVKDILIACIDGLTGFAAALEAVYPQTQVQLCIVHMVRHTMRYVTAKDRKAFVASLRSIYQAPSLQSAEDALEVYVQQWQQKYPSSTRSWQQHWDRITPCFGYPPELRKVIYTTNCVEALNSQMRSILRNHRIFPDDDSVYKLLYLAVRNFSRRWRRLHADWGIVLNQLNILFGNRMPL